MPSGKARTKEDTWNSKDLSKAVRAANAENDERSDGREHRDKDRDRERRKRRDEKDDQRDRERDKHGERRREDDGARKERRRRDEGEVHRKHQDRDERDKRRERDGQEGSSSRRHREEERGREDPDRKRRDGDRDEKRRNRREEENGEASDRRRHRDDEEKSRRRRDDDERSKRHRDDGEKSRRHKDDEEKSRRNRDDEERSKRHRDEKSRRPRDDEERSRRPKDDEERSRRPKDDEERSRRHRDSDERSKRHREDEEKSRRHRDGGEREERKREERKSRQRDEEEDERRRKHRDGEDDGERRHRKHRDETEEDRRKRKEEEREKRHKEMERKERDDKKERDRENYHRERKEEGKNPKQEERSHHNRNREVVHEEVEPEPGYSSTSQEPNAVLGDKSDYNYEDEEFEDYEDDFEDEDEETAPSGVNSNPELEELKRAIAAENDASMAKKKDNRAESPGYRESYNRDSGSTKPSRTSGGGRSGGGRALVNFVSAKQRQVSGKVAQKTWKRGQELMRLIDLDCVQFDILDMPPVKEYEMYIKSFGRSNTKQAYVQCNEENVEKDVQTEEIPIREKWTQFPPEDFVGCGGGDGDVDDEDPSLAKKPNIDTARLTQFLQSSGQVISVLLEEDQSDVGRGALKQNQRNIIFSDGYTQLNGELPFLQGRYVVHAEFHPIQTYLLLAAYSLPQLEKKRNQLSRQGILCLWNINQPSKPLKVLVCQSEPLCCCLSPQKATLAFAGTADGTVALWDLREPSGMHTQATIGGEDWLLCKPTYSTDGVQSDETHHSPVVSLQALVAAQEEGLDLARNTSNDDIGGLSFQLASLEDQAVISIWVVIELDKPDPAGSESDLGLVPGGRVKVLKSSTITLESPFRDVKTRTSVRAFQMQFQPKDPNHFYVATDLGCVLHGARHGGKAPPRAYKQEIDVPFEIVSLDFSPFGLPYFLAASSDGVLFLYSIKFERPVSVWLSSTSGMAASCVRWSRSRPAVFYLVDATAKVYVWDLLQRDSAPYQIEQFTTGRLTTLSLSNDFSATGLGMAGRKPEMVISSESGSVEVHRVSSKFTIQQPNELHQISELLDSMV